MSHIAIRRDGGKQLARPAAPQEWDPMRVMRSLLGWDPFREMAAFPITDDRVATFSPSFEIKETKDSFLFKADVPGVKEADLEVTVTGNRLSIGGKREAEREEQNDTYYAYECSYGTFVRNFTLPDGADVEKLQADLSEGVLTVAIPKKPEEQPKKIAVKSQAPTPATPTPQAKA